MSKRSLPIISIHFAPNVLVHIENWHVGLASITAKNPTKPMLLIVKSNKRHMNWTRFHHHRMLRLGAL